MCPVNWRTWEDVALLNPQPPRGASGGNYIADCGSTSCESAIVGLDSLFCPVALILDYVARTKGISVTSLVR